MAQVDVTAIQTSLTAFVDALRQTNTDESKREDAQAALIEAQNAVTSASEAEAASEASVSEAASALKGAIDGALQSITDNGA